MIGRGKRLIKGMLVYKKKDLSVSKISQAESGTGWRSIRGGRRGPAPAARGDRPAPAAARGGRTADAPRQGPPRNPLRRRPGH